ncbi:MAG: hypothetical protein COW88_02290 [Candidatus Lloydbacteria bacterium CG22_combo_CG10-13_8_21_14_all_47_15]|uniref:RNA polymerase subunit sigma-24 n=1 Tax=Candidatus Lloydbacteria bacterium CG22_combo_CG10-13_8_21_14_all_47_15 TaxID=1974635 RepID=A0A2H0CU07_9BACT|nr:MAG: hypothetical protein COW88_02290 [Candidatus Lloydbacteria bacterium CG22_combo_CG10-13_8_21_14_all_47_15]
MNDQVLPILIKRSREGDTDAFRCIFERLNDRLFQYARAHTVARDDALDIVQDTFIDIWKSLNGFAYRSDEAFYGFVFVILKRKIARYRRINAIRASLPFNEKIANEASYEIEREDYRFVMKALERLATDYQELLKLRYWSDMSFAEIALVMNITEGTAKVRHHRALQKLKDYTANVYEQ